MISTRTESHPPSLKRRATVANLTDAVSEIHALHDNASNQDSPISGLTWTDCLNAWDDMLIKRSPLMSLTKKKGPPPGFGGNGTPKSTSSDDMPLRSSLMKEDSPKRRKSISFAREDKSLKRCVTFTGSILKKGDSGTERGGEAHMRLRIQSGVNPNPPKSPENKTSTLEKIDSNYSFSGILQSALKKSSSRSSLVDSETSSAGSQSPSSQPVDSSFFYDGSSPQQTNLAPPPPPALGDMNTMQFFAQQQAMFGTMMANQAAMMDKNGNTMAHQFYKQQMMFYQQMQNMQMAMMAAQQQQQQQWGMPPPPPPAAPYMPYNGNNNNKAPKQNYHGRVYTPRKGTNQPRQNSNLSPEASFVLSEHKNVGRPITIYEMKKHALEFARDGLGSRQLQHRVEIANNEEREMLLQEMLKDAIPLMQNVFANYVWQTMLDHCTPSQRVLIVNNIRGNVSLLAHHSHGCRVIQRLLEVLDSNGRVMVINELLGDESIDILARELNSCHVLQKAVILLQRDMSGAARAALKSIEKSVAPYIVELSVHTNAYLFICKLIGQNRGVECDDILSSIDSKNFLMLAMDQSGTFVLQHALTKSRNQKFTKRILDFVRDHIVELSMHRFASHLAEVSLQEASKHSKSHVVPLCSELIHPQGRNLARIGHTISDRAPGMKDPVLCLMRDTFANFVYQRAFDVSKGKQRQEIYHKVKNGSEFLKKFKHGRHLVKHVLKNNEN